MIGDGREQSYRDDGPAPWVSDVLLGIGVSLTVSLIIASDITQDRPDARAYLWALGLGALMLVRRRYPITVVAISVATVIAYYAAGYPPIGVGVPLAAAVFSAAECGRMAAAIIASASALLISVTYRLAVGGQEPAYVVGFELPSHALLLAGAVALGDSVRSRRELRRQSARIAELTAEEFARRAEQRVLAERLAIARELHDTVGHTLTVVSLHTQVADEALGSDDAAVRKSLEVIAGAAAETFGDLRRTVTGLRGEEPANRSPLRISDLESAADAARQAGIDVHMNVQLQSPLSPTLEGAIYRIVQESVTNVIRHAGATRVDIDVRERGDGMIDVGIENDGPSPKHTQAAKKFEEGNGIAGMRERAHLLGGSFAAERRSTGFAVKASIPREVTGP